MKARRALTDSRISFAEDMCRELQDLQKVVANHACWSWKRKIVAKDLRGKIKSVPYGNNWQSLFLIHAPPDHMVPTHLGRPKIRTFPGPFQDLGQINKDLQLTYDS